MREVNTSPGSTAVVSEAMRRFIHQMPKVELHVHLEGAIQPETLLILARRNGIVLPADDVEGLRRWYTFRNFLHFVEIYVTVSRCIATLDDLEFVAREFLRGQAEQNILYTEITYTPYTHHHQKGWSAAEQTAALNRAKIWAAETHSVECGFIFDIAREVSPEQGMWTVQAAINGMAEGVVAVGLGGYEVGNPPEKFAGAFHNATVQGVPLVLHAGETGGAASIRGALSFQPARIAHGVRCFEDAALVEHLRTAQMPLDVTPTSNLCLGVFPSMQDHPIRAMLDAGLNVNLGSDDPPMFNISLTGEFERLAELNLGADTFQRLTLNAVRASLLPADKKNALETVIAQEYARLRESIDLSSATKSTEG